MPVYVRHTDGARKLTKREIEVLKLIAEGLSTDDVANKLFVTKSTINFHLGNIFDKLNVSNRFQAVRRAVKLGILPEKTYALLERVDSM